MDLRTLALLLTMKCVGNTFPTPWLSLLGWLFFITWITTQAVPQHARRVLWFFMLRADEAVSWRRSTRRRAILADAHVFLALPPTHMVKRFLLPFGFAVVGLGSLLGVNYMGPKQRVIRQLVASLPQPAMHPSPLGVSTLRRGARRWPTTETLRHAGAQKKYTEWTLMIPSSKDQTLHPPPRSSRGDFISAHSGKIDGF